MLNKAAIAFAKLYSIEQAEKNGFTATHPHLEASQAADRISEITQQTFDYGLKFATFNKQMMSQLQEDPENMESHCFDKTAAMNAEILSLSDLQVFILEGFESDQIFSRLNVMQFKLSQQIEACFTQEGLQYGLPRAEEAAMNWGTEQWNEQSKPEMPVPKFVAAGKSISTQILNKLSEEDKQNLSEAASKVMEGFSLASLKFTEGSSLVASKARAGMQDEQNREILDKGVQLGLSQLLKLTTSAADLATVF